MNGNEEQQPAPGSPQPPEQRTPPRAHRSLRQEPEREPTPEELIAAVESLESRDKGWVHTLLVLGFTLLAFSATGLLQNPWLDVVILVAVIFIHELGHFIGMRIFRYRNVKMFFIPFFGAGVSGEHIHVEGWKKAVVCLLGPLPGLFIGLALLWFNLRKGDPIHQQVATTFILLNAFNLLPVYPLDGGRMVQEILFVRSRHLEAGFRVVAGLTLMGGAWVLGAWVLGIVGFFVLTSASYAWRIGGLADTLKACGLVEEGPPPERLPPDVAAVMIPLIKDGFPHVGAAKDYAPHARAIWEKLAARPPEALASAILMVVYGASFAILIGGLLSYGLASSFGWQQDMTQGRQAISQRRHADAIRHYQDAVGNSNNMSELDPRRAESQEALGQAHAVAGEFAAAEESLRKAVALRQKIGEPVAWADALIMLAGVLEKRNGDAEEIGRLRQKAKELNAVALRD